MKETPLTPQQQLCLEIITKHGYIERKSTGDWGAPEHLASCKPSRNWRDSARLPGSVIISMISKGLLTITERLMKLGAPRPYPTKCTTP